MKTTFSPISMFRYLIIVCVMFAAGCKLSAREEAAVEAAEKAQSACGGCSQASSCGEKAAEEIANEEGGCGS